MHIVYVAAAVMAISSSLPTFNRIVAARRSNRLQKPKGAAAKAQRVSSAWYFGSQFPPYPSVFTCDFQDAGLGPVGSLLLLNLLLLL